MKRVNITIAEWILEELDYMANKKGMNRSQFLAMLVSDEFMEWQRNSIIDDDWYRRTYLTSEQSMILE